MNQQWFSVFDLEVESQRTRTILCWAEGCITGIVRNGLPSCLNHCAWPRAQPEPVSLCFFCLYPTRLQRNQGMGSAMMSSTKVYRSSETLTLTPLPFCSKRNMKQATFRVCYSFYLFFGILFFGGGGVKKAPAVC